MKQRTVRTHEIMGTVCSTHIVCDGGDRDRDGDGSAVDAAVEDFIDGLRDLERLFSPFLPGSDVSRLRRRDLDPADADPRVREVAALCEAAERATAGRFSAHWRGGFDPTGYVKGWSVDVMGARYLEPLLAIPGVRSIGVNAGGDVREWSSPEEHREWRIGIADPQRPGAVLATVGIISGAVATSGTAERGRHIIDPATGSAVEEVLSATVVADDLTTADVWATAGVVAGGDLSWIRSAPVSSGLVVASDGALRRFAGGVEIESPSIW